MPISLSPEQAEVLADLADAAFTTPELFVEQLNMLFPLADDLLLERAHVAYELNDGHLPLTYAAELMGRGFILDELKAFWEIEHDEIWEAM